MKILWLCNISFSLQKNNATGSWLQPLAEALITTQNCKITCIAFGNVKNIVKYNVNGITQYIIPNRKQKKYGQVACNKTCQDVIRIENEYQPDIIHIWGTENVWCSIHAKKMFSTKKILLDIQGLLKPYTDYYLGGLTFKEILSCIYLKEFLLPNRNLYSKAHFFKQRGLYEEEFLKSFSHISTQSNWVRNYIRIKNPNAHIYNTKIILRQEFYDADIWKYKTPNDSPIIFSSCSAAIPYKGMHQLIKMAKILKTEYPNIQIRIAGAVNVGNKLLDGYSIYLNKMIREYGLTNNIIYLGSINSVQIVSELQNCNVCVIPSYIETYCLALAEALIIGVPCVVSYAGALPETAVPNEEALFYNSNDYIQGAALIKKIINNKELAINLGTNARSRRLIENDIESVLNTQMNIYNQLV